MPAENRFFIAHAVLNLLWISLSHRFLNLDVPLKVHGVTKTYLRDEPFFFEKMMSNYGHLEVSKEGK
jgi:hypothetical protein